MVIYRATVSLGVTWMQWDVRTNDAVKDSDGNYRAQRPEGIPENQISVLEYASRQYVRTERWSQNEVSTHYVDDQPQ
jgi:hypothetical protein